MPKRTPKTQGKEPVNVYVALLRGINVGGNSIISMAELKVLFEKLGYFNVRTFINSGNVIFCTEEARGGIIDRLEKAIQRRFKLSVKIFLRDESDMQHLVDALPKSWVNNDSYKCDILFLSDEIDTPLVVRELPYTPAIEKVKYFPGAVGWFISRKKVSKSKMFKLVGTPLYKQMTARNPNSVRKIYELMRSLKEGNGLQ